MPNLGSILPFSTDVYDKPVESGGVLTNAQTSVLTVTLPDGTTVTPTVTNPSTGKYVGNYQTTAASPLGRYLGHWVLTFSGGAVDTYDETIDVVSTIVTTDEALQHLRAAGVIETEPDIDYLEWLCSVATNAIELALGRSYVRRTVVEVHSGGSGSLILRHSPVLSVTSVAESGSSLSSGDYVLDPEMPILYRGSTSYSRPFSTGRLNVTVTYVVGSLNPPPVVRKVALNAVQGMWQSSQQAEHAALEDFASEAVGVATAALTPLELNAYNSLRAAAIA
jgi:hypothetical protein